MKERVHPIWWLTAFGLIALQIAYLVRGSKKYVDGYPQRNVSTDFDLPILNQPDVMLGIVALVLVLFLANVIKNRIEEA